MAHKKASQSGTSTKNDNAQRKVTISTFQAVQKLTTLKAASPGALSSVGNKLQAALGKKANTSNGSGPPLAKQSNVNAKSSSTTTPQPKTHITPPPLPQTESEDNAALHNRIRELEAIIEGASSKPPPVERLKGEAGRSGKNPKKPGFPLIVGMGLDKTFEDGQAYDKMMVCLYFAIVQVLINCPQARLSHIMSMNGIEPDTKIRSTSALSIANVITDMEKEFPDYINADRWSPPYWPIYDMIKMKTRGKRAYRTQSSKFGGSQRRRKTNCRNRRASTPESDVEPPPSDRTPSPDTTSQSGQLDSVDLASAHGAAPPDNDDDFYATDKASRTPDAAPPGIAEDNLFGNAPLDDADAGILGDAPLDDEDLVIPSEPETDEELLACPERQRQLRLLGPVVGPALIISPVPKSWPPYMPTDPPSWVTHDNALKDFLHRGGKLVSSEWWHKFLSRRFADYPDNFEAFWDVICRKLNVQPGVAQAEAKPPKRPTPPSSSSSQSTSSKKLRLDVAVDVNTSSDTIFQTLKPRAIGATALISSVSKAQFPYRRSESVRAGSPLSSIDDSEAEYEPSGPRGEAEPASHQRRVTRSGGVASKK
ncbi:hypothetical protein BKA70DRAFT_1307005 [Coprinopsis sp. MPI-PUGE-AT-0042]|nr:hypothetical protein BKA70DRAFT_1307005 [Coprinopsis sp. MPI-PUGE-AT-0042]